MRKLVAFTLPMAVFVTLLGLTSAGNRPETTSWLSYPVYWIYPIQTVICGALIVWFWRDYEFRTPRSVWFALAIGVGVFVLWIAPQQFFGADARVIGFSPEVFDKGSTFYWITLLLRFVRLVGVAPLIRQNHVWGFAGGVEVADFLDLISAPAHAEAVASAVLDYIGRSDGEAEFRNLRPDSIGAVQLRAV